MEHYKAKNTALSNFPPISYTLYHFLSVHKKETTFAFFILECSLQFNTETL